MWIFHILCLAELTSLAASAYEMPLTRIEPQMVKMIRKRTWLNYTKEKEERRIKVMQGRTMSSAYPHEWINEKVSQYGTGAAAGFFGNDTLKFGASGSNHLTVPGTVFGQAKKIASFFVHNPMDGVLGLAFEKVATGNVTPPLIRAINLGLLDEPVFTVYLKHVGEQEHVYGGVFTYGGIDTKNCEAVMDYQPVTASGYWQFRMAAVSIGKFSSTAGWEVISDTGTSLIHAPTAIADAIAKEYGAQEHSTTGFYVIPCDVDTDIVFTIGDKAYNIQSHNMILPTGDICMLALSKMSGLSFGTEWILGDPFIRQYCNIHDIGGRRIGFAKAIQ
ncbi:eukaryotic aspartyl protease [Ancylostoma ceylanicum]|uniref:Eukaryotic aspartyl protease n=1 Tax=Ancylostoma ceylanicum TaxID=53326 RepID=A0A0D6LNT3_9BILA|nr:eukaryotic aspartyl protease [Ancylostoma ceylanicum]